jgi:hypothetical protein
MLEILNFHSYLTLQTICVEGYFCTNLIIYSNSYKAPVLV